MSRGLGRTQRRIVDVLDRKRGLSLPRLREELGEPIDAANLGRALRALMDRGLVRDHRNRRGRNRWVIRTDSTFK